MGCCVHDQTPFLKGIGRFMSEADLATLLPLDFKLDSTSLCAILGLVGLESSS